MLLGVLLLTLVGKAQKVQIDGIYYELDTNTETASVTFESRDDKNAYVNSYTGDIVVPAYVEHEGGKYRVTTIGKGGFANTKTLKHVTLPDGLKKIDNGAFGNCEGLTSIDIPSDVEVVGNLAFYQCTNLTKVTFAPVFPSLYLGRAAFYKCTSLESIKLPEVINGLAISPLTFAECRALKKVEHTGHINIGEQAFLNCTSLESAGIKDIDTYLENSFEGCSALGQEDLAEMARRTQEKELAKVQERKLQVQKIAMAKEDERISNILYRYLERKDSIDAIGNKKPRPFTADAVVNVDGVQYDIDLQLKEAKVSGADTSLENVVIPPHVTYEGKQYDVIAVANAAFRQNKSLSSIAFSDRLTTIGEMAFMGCEHLQTVTMPTNKNILLEKSAFEACHSLTQIAFADTVGSVRFKNRAFYGCHSLTQVTLPHLNLTNAMIFVIAPALVVDTLAFAQCSKLQSINMEDATCVDAEAFVGCTSLENVTVGQTLTKVADNAFQGCTALPKGLEKAIRKRVKDNQSLNNSAQFSGDIYAWIRQSIKYPTICYEQGIQGRVLVSFYIEEDGSITNVSVLKAPDLNLAAEAARVVLSMPKWKPARFAGKPFRMYYILPVMFRLS